MFLLGFFLKYFLSLKLCGMELKNLSWKFLKNKVWICVIEEKIKSLGFVFRKGIVDIGGLVESYGRFSLGEG